MSRYALILDGVVVNLINADPDHIAELVLQETIDLGVDLAGYDGVVVNIGDTYLDGVFTAAVVIPPQASFEFRSTVSVDKNNEDQAVSGADWVKIEAKRVLWDLVGDYVLADSLINISQKGVYDYDIQVRVSDLVNVSAVEIALFQVGNEEDDYWFTLSRAYIAPGQASVHMGNMTQFDFYPDEQYYVAIQLTSTDPELTCSATILGSDDYTAWGSSWSAPLINAYRG